MHENFAKAMNRSRGALAFCNGDPIPALAPKEWVQGWLEAAQKVSDEVRGNIIETDINVSEDRAGRFHAEGGKFAASPYGQCTAVTRANGLTRRCLRTARKGGLCYQHGKAFAAQ